MEHAIGTEIILPDGRKAEVIEDKKCIRCAGCVFDNYMTCGKKCAYLYRKDHKNIIYKEIK